MDVDDTAPAGAVATIALIALDMLSKPRPRQSRSKMLCVRYNYSGLPFSVPRDQTTSILGAVSGKFWDNDPDHPQPDNGIKGMLGFPAFPANAHYDVEAENIK